jgi:SAM-dependent methyltransferase
MAVPFQPKTSLWQRILDHLFFPINMWLGEEASYGLGLTPIDHERVRMALPHCRGRLLDVACGNNLLARAYGSGIGADVHPYPEISVRCESCPLPFKSNTIDTIALLACLNHITRRSETLAECNRVLVSDGRLLITMIPAWVGFFSHKIRKRHDPDQLERGMAHDEDWGLSTGTLRKLLQDAGFRIVTHKRFMWGLNNFYLAVKVRQGPNDK